MNILEEFYYNNIKSDESILNDNIEYSNFIKILAFNENKLFEFFNTLPYGKQEKHLFSQMINAQKEIVNFTELEYFIKGFRIGAKFMLDTFLFSDEKL